MQSINAGHLFLLYLVLFMVFCFFVGSWMRDGVVTLGTPERGTPHFLNRYYAKMVITAVFGLAEGAIADYLDISRNEMPWTLLILDIFCVIAGIFIKFRNFSWWRNCRFSKRFY
jgi:hypothetical protein